MLISILVGYAIGYALGCIIAEICIKVSGYFNVEKEIRQKAAEQIKEPIGCLEVYIKNANKSYDEEILEIKAYGLNNNHIANIKVTSENKTRLVVGQKF